MKKLLMLLCLSNFVQYNAQQQWRIDGNNNTNSNNFIGTNANQPLIFKTNGVSRALFDENGNLTFYGFSVFNRGLESDSLRILKHAFIDSLHVRTLKVGNSWSMNDAGPAYFPFLRPYNQQLQNASDNRHVFEGGSFAGGTPVTRDNVRVVVGFLNSPNGPQHRFLVHSNFSNDVFSAYTNINSYGIPTSYAATDGFKVGILASGIAQINQQENLPLQFHTNNTQRAIILANGRTGINNVNPLNRFVVTSAAADFGGGNVLTPGGSSGIRTTNMTSATPTLAGNGKVVTVNANGDFYLAPDGGSGGTVTATAKNGLNTAIGAPDVELGGPLVRNTVVADAGFDLWWTQASGGRFGLGDFTNTFWPFTNATFQSINQNTGGNFYLRNTSPGGIVGIEMDIVGSGAANYGHIIKVNSAQNNIGISAVATGAVGTIINEGIIATSFEGKETYGGIFNATNGDPSAFIGFGSLSQLFLNDPHYYSRRSGSASMVRGIADGTKYGAVATTHNSNNDMNVGFGGIIGVNGINTIDICNGTTIKNIAVYGGFFDPVPGNQFNSQTAGNYAGYFDGNVVITGTMNVNGVPFPSDANLKTNIDSMGSVMSIIKQLKPKEFYYDTTRYFLANNNKKQYGFVAQEIETVLPELVGNYSIADRKDSLGNVVASGGTYKNLNYNALLAFLVRGMQEQQKTIDSLVNGNQQQNRAPNSNQGNEDAQQIKENVQKNITRSNITLSDADALVLDQNQPNPFNESTLIKFNVPQKYAYAQLIFTTEDGRIIKTVDVSKKGRNELTVYANDLSSGIYHYTLVVDGKTIDTKKMVKQ